MLTNHKPVVSGTDEGIWRRLRLVPWDVVVPTADRDRELPARLALEADAVLAWLVAGYHDWHARGLADPDEVTEATAAYRADSDAVARFVGQRCMNGPNFTARSSELFAAWSKWCATEGVEAGTNKAFTESLQNRGYDTRHTNMGTIWKGLGLAAEGDG